MEIIGKIIVALPEVSGTSKAGNAWKKREYVLETVETYPKKVHFDFFGERADQYPLNVGDEIKLSFDIESREYNGRWYTSIRGWKSEPAQAPCHGRPGNAHPCRRPVRRTGQCQRRPPFLRVLHNLRRPEKTSVCTGTRSRGIHIYRNLKLIYFGTVQQILL